MSRHIQRSQSGSINGHVFTKVVSENCEINPLIKISRKKLEDLAWNLISVEVDQIDKKDLPHIETSDCIYAKDYIFKGENITLIFSIRIKAEILEIIDCDLSINLESLSRLQRVK